MFQLLELIENEEDREFCRKLSEQFDSAMYHVAYGILKNSADAEDAVQESYVAIINNLDKISRENCHEAWNYIVAIVRSRAINVYRRRNRESKMDEDTIENLLQESQGDGEIFELPDGSSMSELIGRMKYPYKDVLYLRYYNELSYEEIATALDTTVDNARHISSHNLNHTVDVCPRIALLENGVIIRDIRNENNSAEQELEAYFNVGVEEEAVVEETVVEAAVEEITEKEDKTVEEKNSEA